MNYINIIYKIQNLLYKINVYIKNNFQIDLYLSYDIHSNILLKLKRLFFKNSKQKHAKSFS